MQTEQPSQFRLNPRVYTMAALTVLALGLPLALVGVFVATNSGSSEKSMEADPGLEKSLEEIADKALAPKALASGNREAIRRKAQDPAATVERISRLAASVGGTVLPAESEPGSLRLWVSIPERRVPAFVEECENDIKELEFPPISGDSSNLLIEIIVEKS